MLILPHIMVGAALGSKISNPYVVGIVSLGSHFILDSIPHWQETLYPYKPTKITYIRIFFELLISLLLIYTFTITHPDQAKNILLGSVMGLLPDLDSFLVFTPKLLKYKIIRSWWNFHCHIQRETNSLWGLVPQFLVILFSLLVISKI